MTTSKIVLFILLISRSFSLFSQENKEKLEIKYFDFNMTTDMKIECSEFERAGDYKTIQIDDSISISTVLLFISNFKEDTSNNYMPDTRAKIIFFNKYGIENTICISNFAICYNNKHILYDEKFINYIKEIIKQKDKKFIL